MMLDQSGWLWRLRRVTAAELLLLGEAQVALIACQLAKWVRPVGRLVQPAGIGAGGGVAPGPEAARMIGWAVARAAHYGIFRPKCLVRSLAIQRMLRRRGWQTGDLRIGVRLQEGQLLAHAWVELAGRVIGDAPDHVRTFTPAPDLRLVEL